mmetsp:Transcript_32919/g.54347  ORF Transcript_32919/g.54347 Transcript_32919/m.54347 type:complete len:82 (+) Transcript_32919:456-701(+)
MLQEQIIILLRPMSAAKVKKGTAGKRTAEPIPQHTSTRYASTSYILVAVASKATRMDTARRWHVPPNCGASKQATAAAAVE